MAGHLIWMLNSINNKHFHRFATQIVTKLGLHNSPTALNKENQCILCSITRISTSEHSNLRLGYLTNILTNRKQIYSRFWKYFLWEPKKMLSTWKHQIIRGQLRNHRPRRKTVCSTFPQNFSLHSQPKLSPIRLLYSVTLCLKLRKVSRNTTED